MVYKYDFLIIGAGVAGMSYALKVARAKKGKVWEKKRIFASSLCPRKLRDNA